MNSQHMQIGEVANRTGLSLRTIRYYEEMELVTPSARSAGGFRLYTEDDLARLSLIKRMKPLDFSLEEMRDLLSVVDGLEIARGKKREALVDRLRMYREAAGARVEAIRTQLTTAEEFALELEAEVHKHQAPRV
ncbi:MerR family transcriptional regulator [Nocardioides ferulae]|uniref:MerR family transcriptional regulator n=1 Tax=Nocardioides ferulae TaxID=2340821 RepID=UPI000EB0499F|nr:MerR family transcriptional regulator [Nocardioides ferulae]